MDSSPVTLVLFVLVFSSASFAIYLISDYYMDDGWSRSFGQSCDQTVGDDCAYINSHLNTFGLDNYDSDISCTTMLDAGKQRDARYKFTWKRFDLEDSINCTSDSLTLYDGHIYNTSAANRFGAFCGSNDPNTTGFPSQRYVTLKFRTDGGTNKKGFRLMVTRTVPYPCPGSDFFHCKAENRCIDGRLKCDGTVQCDDETDEDDCSFWEKLIGGILALGVAGIVGITGACLAFCVGVGVVICVCKCCKGRCGRLFRRCGTCWDKLCTPVKDKMAKLKIKKVGILTSKGDKVELVDVDETDVGNAETGPVKAYVNDSDRNVTSEGSKSDNDRSATSGNTDRDSDTKKSLEKDAVAEDQGVTPSGDGSESKEGVIARETIVTPRDVNGVVQMEPGTRATKSVLEIGTRENEINIQSAREPATDSSPENETRPKSSAKTGKLENIGLAQDGGVDKSTGVTKVDTE